MHVNSTVENTAVNVKQCWAADQWSTL